MEWSRGPACQMSGLAVVRIKRTLNAGFGFGGEAGRMGVLRIGELVVALAQYGAQEGQLMLVLPAEEADAEMQLHAQACVPGQCAIHRIGQQPRHVLARVDEGGAPAHALSPSCA